MKNATHVFLIFLLVCIADLSLDFYVPAMPYIASVFNVDDSIVRLTISVNIAALALSSLFYGILSDYYGRRPIIISGLVIFAVSTIFCYLANNIQFLIVARFLQGLGQGVAMVVGYASIRDVYKGDRYSQIISVLNMIVAISPALGPIVGSFIVAYYNWKVLFLILFIILLGILTLYMLFFDETLHEKSSSVSVKYFFTAYAKLCTNKIFVGYGMIQVLTFVWLWNDIATVPFLFMDTMGLPVHVYGFVITFNVVFYVIGTIINQKFVMKVGSKKMLLIGLMMPIFTDSILILLHYCNVALSPMIIQTIWIPSNIALAFILSNSITNALSNIPSNDSAKATGLITFVEMLLSGIAVYCIGLFYAENILSTAYMCVTCSTICIIIFYFLSKIEDKSK